MPVSHELVEAVCRQLYHRWEIVDCWEERSGALTDATIEAAHLLSSRDVVVTLVEAIGHDHVYEPDENAVGVIRAALLEMVGEFPAHVDKDGPGRRELAIARAQEQLERASGRADLTPGGLIELADAWLRLADYYRATGPGDG